ncbi:MAG: NUDIX hydrolase [Flavobacteriales bacterium]|nr:NUDIX hydrolase [Flavobacteriales bacterium]MCB9166387.1 NUDIX hydrolase [Flavobacteriales bacterium]
MEDRGPWKTIRMERVYASPWIEVDHHDVIDPSGAPGTYGVVHFRNLAIGILPLDQEMNTWIIGQYRYPVRKYSWEIPEGGGDRNVAPLESAARELREEAGIVAKEWTELLRMDLSNSASDEEAIIYLARDLEFHAPEPDSNEELMVRKLSFDALYAMVDSGEITDSLTVAAVLKARLWILEGRIVPQK